MKTTFANIYVLRSGLTLAGICVLLVFLLKSRTASRDQPLSRSFRVASIFAGCVFILLAGYQARWQLFGFFSSDFLRVQRGFDPRGDILGVRFHRGSLLDRRHIPLAYDSKTDMSINRLYPLGEAAVHILGYNHAKYGSSGMEKVLDPLLMGRAVKTPADVFRLAGNVFFHRTLRGNPVVLSLDRDLQLAAWDLLSGKTGSIVVVDPRDGSIRAMASRPGFDPGKLDDGLWASLRASAGSPFLNRAAQGLYPPGSTFKILVAATAVERQRSPVYRCGPGGFDCGPADPRVKDHAHYSNPGFEGHGNLNLAEALTVSCNVYFAQLAVDLTAPVILETAARAGLNARVPFTGPSLNGARAQLPERSKWHVARTARLGIGQDDILVTPLHLALLAGAIGNGGMLFRPKLVETQMPVLWDRIFDQRTAHQVARMMIKTVETGTAGGAKVQGIVVGGKTGTAESAGRRSHALFVCFAPWPRPALAMAVVIEHGGMGGLAAAPLAAELIRRADDLGLLEDGDIYHGAGR
jgi:penicillin-binding protein A